MRERFLKEAAFEDVTLESERKRIFKDFMHVLEVSAAVGCESPSCLEGAFAMDFYFFPF